MTTVATERVAANVRAELARRGLSQRELAKTLNLSQQSISRRLRGATPFDVNDLAAIAGFLSLDIAELTVGAAA